MTGVTVITRWLKSSRLVALRVLTSDWHVAHGALLMQRGLRKQDQTMGKEASGGPVTSSENFQIPVKTQLSRKAGYDQVVAQITCLAEQEESLLTLLKDMGVTVRRSSFGTTTE